MTGYSIKGQWSPFDIKNLKGADQRRSYVHRYLAGSSEQVKSKEFSNFNRSNQP